jgi:hypothetical protein
MKRALHYASTTKSRFGAGSDSTQDEDTDLIFVLAPLNYSAEKRIRSSIDKSLTDGKRVEVHMQAFSEDEPGSNITATNLLPMNFNQYCSDDPEALVRIINDYKLKTNVSFYIFPTQTTKNSYFWSAEAKQVVTNMLDSAIVDPWIRMATVTWLLKDADIESTADTKPKRSLHQRFADVDADLVKLKALDPLTIQSVFDPFCVHCAAYKKSDERPFENVPGSKKLNAACVSVEMKDTFTDQETKKEFADTTHVKMNRPRFKKVEEKRNCYRVGWDTDTATADAKSDGQSYMNSLFASVSGGPCEVKRTVNRVLFIQDFYDYDNKFSVWYALLMIGASIFELYSVGRPVANKELMKEIRSKFKPPELDGGFSQLQSALGKDARNEWGQYPPAGPVYTKERFETFAAALLPSRPKEDDETSQEQEPKRHRSASAFDEYKAAINADHTKESLDDSKKIALTWYVFLCYMMKKGMIANKETQMSVVNGGYTSHHRFNPAMHTIQEDWITDVNPKLIGTLYSSFDINNPVTVNSKHIDGILEELKITVPAAAAAFGSRLRK